MQKKQVRNINKSKPNYVEEHQSKQTDVMINKFLVQLLGSQTQSLSPLKTC